MTDQSLISKWCRMAANTPSLEILLTGVRSVVALLLSCLLFGASTAADEAASKEFFAQQVAPLLTQHCLDCHGPDQQEGQLRLDSLQFLNAGGTSGPPIVPGKPDESLLVAAVRYGDEALQMPPDGKLKAEEIATLTSWIAAGAVHPDGALTTEEPPAPFDVEQARRFWAFQPPLLPELPNVDADELIRNPVDQFIVSELSRKGLTPNSIADRRTLIRRATFDLTGLPPTAAEIDAFEADPDADAFSKVIDRLLQSPHYGEHWGRHWLDVVRYADSNGLDENVAHGNAFRYRDYVIASINADKPWDQFIREQIAGDLLVNGEADEFRRAELLTATGFLSLGPKVLAEADKTKMLMDILDEQVDTTGRAFLGLTFGCARCHNHKFDPVSQADYFALVGIFKSTYTMESLATIAKWNENSVATSHDEAALKTHQTQIEDRKTQIASLIKATQDSLQTGVANTEENFPEHVRNQLTTLRAEQKHLEQSVPVLPTAMGVKEGTPESARINIRGSHLTLGRPVSRGVPVVLQTGGPIQITEGQSGRRQLADWLVDSQNPLTARVFVNRVWRWHFGRGLVASTDNFGKLGERPTNPALLDWLTIDFVRSGWSLKSLHRTIMLSRTYQLSGDENPAASLVDPDNTLHWKFNMRRLQAESIRDSVLAVSGLLDRTMQGSMLHVANREFLFNHTSKDETRYDSLRRTVYLPVIRNNLYDGMSLFDCTDAAVSNGDRTTSTVASQALFVMNSELLRQASAALASQLIVASPTDHSARIQELFRRTLGRAAEREEQETLQQFADAMRNQLEQEQTPTEQLEARTWAVLCQSVLASNEFIYVR